ncbi:MAG: hypothetical protein AB7F43_12590 [Bacteriovoracia bacterium]
MTQQIPIKNLYYLLSYAWRFQSVGLEATLTEARYENSHDMMAALLCLASNYLAKRGLIRKYISEDETLRTIKGKVLLLDSVKAFASRNCQVQCRYDDYTANNELNRIIKTTMYLVLRDFRVAGELRHCLRTILSRYTEVQEFDLHSLNNALSNTTIKDRSYLFAIELCRLIVRGIGISNETRNFHMRDFLGEQLVMHKIFEDFIFNFLKRHLKDQVKRENLKWDVQSFGAGSLFENRIPQMRTDVTIVGDKLVRVVDAKYYQEALESYEGAKKYYRAHLSQLVDYLRTSQTRHRKNVRGFLIYPTVGESLLPEQNTGTINGYQVIIATIDLALPWNQIHSQLLDILSYEPSFVSFADAV